MKRYLTLIPVFLLLALLLTACGDELARIPIVGVGEGTTEFSHEGGTIKLWADFNATYRQRERPFMQYQVKFYQKGDLVVEKTCSMNDINLRVMKTESTKNGIVTTKYQGLMDCDTELPEGSYTLSATFSADGRNYELFKNDLVLKVK